jgi:uncharacterized protein with HEPN domain
MQADDMVYIGHMLDMARKAADKVQGLRKDAFDDDENRQLALAHLIQTIGEAAARVSQETRQDNPDIPWREITGMRNKIVHDYMGLDFDVVWEVATKDLTHLIGQLDSIIPSPGD